MATLFSLPWVLGSRKNFHPSTLTYILIAISLHHCLCPVLQNLMLYMRGLYPFVLFPCGHSELKKKKKCCPAPPPPQKGEEVFSSVIVLMAVGGSLNCNWHLLFILHLLLPVGVVLSLQFSQRHL